jgi:hypothetical protein
MRCGETGTSIATSGRAPSPTPHGCAEEGYFVPSLEPEPSAPPSSSTSTLSRFMGRLGANAPSLSSLRTIPSWRSSLFPLSEANKSRAKLHPRYSSDEPDPPSLSHPGSAKPHHPSLSSLQRRYVRRQNNRTTNPNGGRDPQHTSVPNLRSRRHEYSSGSSRSSLSTRPSSSYDSHVPSPTTSEESYPSPYSVDARAVFHASRDKHRASFFKGRRKQDRVQVIFEEATETSSTSVAVSSAHSLAKSRGRLSRLKRRIGALAESVSPPRSKAPTAFSNERLSPHLDDDDSVDYDIPCLAYISCFW